MLNKIYWLGILGLATILAGCNKTREFGLTENEIEVQSEHDFSILVSGRNPSLSPDYGYEVLNTNTPAGIEFVGRGSFHSTPYVDGGGGRIIHRFRFRGIEKGTYNIIFEKKPFSQENRPNDKSLPVTTTPELHRSVKVTVN